MIVDGNAIIAAKKAGVKNLYDADGDGDIDMTDLAIIQGKAVPGITAKLGSPAAQDQFAGIEAKASKSGMYRGKSLDWGKGGRSMLLRDRLLCDGHSLQDAEGIVKMNYFAKKGLHS